MSAAEDSGSGSRPLPGMVGAQILRMAGQAAALQPRWSALPVGARLPSLDAQIEEVLFEGEDFIVYRATSVAGAVAVHLFRPPEKFDAHSGRHFAMTFGKFIQPPDPLFVPLLCVDSITIGGRVCPYLVHAWTSEPALGTGAAPSLRQSVVMVAAIARGLDALHRAGLAHGMLVPARIHWRPGELRPLLTGLCVYAALAFLGSDTARGIGHSTIGFAAPELQAGLPPDALCDVFAAGAVLLWLLTGCVAQPGIEVPRFAQWPQLDLELEAICRRSLSTRDARIASAAEFAGLLDSYLIARDGLGRASLVVESADETKLVRIEPPLVAGRGAALDLPAAQSARAFEIIDTGGGLAAIPFDLPITVDGKETRDPFILCHGDSFSCAGVHFTLRLDAQ